MSTWTDRLTQLGIVLPAGPAESPRRAGHPSTELLVVDGVAPATGPAGTEVSAERLADLARACALTALAAVDAAAGIDSVVQVVRVLGYVSAGVTDRSAVLTGATDLLERVFGAAGSAARTAVAVTELPHGAPVGIELLVAVSDRRPGPPTQDGSAQAGPAPRAGSPSSPAAGPGSALLTPQERQIAELAARGLTNKAIAERLFLSPRTVGAHLYHVFPKLGIGSRAALRDALS